MRVGCGLRVRRIDGNEYLYFWHYEREGGRSERREDYVGPVREAKSRQEAARKPLAFHRRVQQAPRAVLVVVLRSSGGGVRRLRRPLFGSPPRRPRRRVRETADASGAGREGVWPGPVRLRRRGTVPEPRDPVVVCPTILLRGRAPGTPRHHRYYARPASPRAP